jgi:putative transposase
VFNQVHDLSGYVWQDRFFSCPLDDNHFRAAVRYVELNPVRAGLVARAEDYLWSSARAHCSLEDNELLCELPSVFTDIKDWAEWLALGNVREIDGQIREKTLTGRPCGDEEFVRRLELQRDNRRQRGDGGVGSS